MLGKKFLGPDFILVRPKIDVILILIAFPNSTMLK